MTTPSIPPSPKDVIDRLPPGVEYTFVKMIVTSTPLDPLLLMLLRTRETWSYEQFLQDLDKRKALVNEGLDLFAPESRRKELEKLTGVEHMVLRTFIRDPEVERQGRRFQVLLPSGYDVDGRPRYHDPIRIQVWSRPRMKGLKAKLLGEEVVPSGEQDLEHFNLAVRRLARQHCKWDELMRRRPISEWRSKRHRRGWPAVTTRLIPDLYDYLLPYYSVRRFTISRWGTKKKQPGPRAFPSDLMRDIAEILQTEQPLVCGELTANRVKSAVRWYLRTADPKRRRGKDIFTMPVPEVGRKVESPKKRREKD